ncbi:MAG TPA: hypothetical protein VNI58_09970 [Mariprofundaceae bacterium]|nr:hypothetical protein [Mariprofundaceae bacterium]
MWLEFSRESKNSCLPSLALAWLKGLLAGNSTAGSFQAESGRAAPAADVEAAWAWDAVAKQNRQQEARNTDRRKLYLRVL